MITKCPKCGSAVIGVEYWITDPNHYDGVSEYSCSQAFEKTLDGKVACDWRIGRFCGKELKEDEAERRYCDGSEHPKIQKTI